MTRATIRVGGKARLTKRSTGVPKGNSYPVLSIVNGKALLSHPTKNDKLFQLRDLS